MSNDKDPKEPNPHKPLDVPPAKPRPLDAPGSTEGPGRNDPDPNPDPGSTEGPGKDGDGQGGGN